MSNPRGLEAVRIGTAFSVVGTLFVLSRLWIRIFLIGSPGLEDLFIAAGLCFSTAFTVLLKVQEQGGLGKHIYDLVGQDLTGSLQALLASIICYYIALACIKISILCQYRRIFDVPTVRRNIDILGCFVLVYSVETVLATVFLCVPVAKFWKPDMPGVCVNKRVIWFFNSGIHILTDFLIILLPMPVLKHLNLPRKQKRALIIVFAIGGLACVTSIMRLHSLVKISRSTDLTYDNADTATWSVGEINIALICACLPALRPGVARIMPKLFGGNSLINMSGKSQITLSAERESKFSEFPGSTAHRGSVGPQTALSSKGNSDDSSKDEQDNIHGVSPIESKCWSNRTSANNQSSNNVATVGTGQIMIVQNLHQQFQKQDV